MSTTTATIPAGTYKTDGVHSTAGFSVKHMIVSTFRGRFDAYAATLTVDDAGNLSLEGSVPVDSIVVKDENLAAHLQSPEFFDAENHPTITFTSAAVRVDGEDVVVDGDLTIKGHTERVQAKGTITEPAEGFAGTVVGLNLETIIDRSKIGLNWNAPLPKGGFALANEVKLTTDLELIKGA
jgi:polyisoprenoid-binding protein YceI